MDKELDNLKKGNEVLKHKIAKIRADRDSEIQTMADTVATIMKETFDFCRDYVSSVNSETFRKDGPRLYFSNKNNGEEDVYIKFNRFTYRPLDDTLLFRDIVLPTIPEFVGKYSRDGVWKSAPIYDYDLNELYQELKIVLESNGECWKTLARSLVKFTLEKERSELENELLKLA